VGVSNGKHRNNGECGFWRRVSYQGQTREEIGQEALGGSREDFRLGTKQQPLHKGTDPNGLNAAGVNPLTLHYAGYGDLIKNLGSNVVSYNVGGEILTSGQFALSAMIPTAASANHYTFWPRNFPFSTWNPATLHRPEPTFEAVR
jgi:hypothetical protein